MTAVHINHIIDINCIKYLDKENRNTEHVRQCSDPKTLDTSNTRPVDEGPHQELENISLESKKTAFLNYTHKGLCWFPWWHGKET
jgi:hypothetical protein